MSYRDGQDPPAELARSCRQISSAIEGERGSFAYQAFDWINATLYRHSLPTPLILWGLNPHSHSLGFTRIGDELHLIMLHPSLLGGTEKVDPWGIEPEWLGPTFALDVLIHESIHLSNLTRAGGFSGESSHNSPEWISELNRLSPLLGFPSFRAGANKLKRVAVEDEYGPSGKPKTKPKRVSQATLHGEMVPFDLVARFPHALREYLGNAEEYYGGGLSHLPFSCSLKPLLTQSNIIWY
jgi:hypothetical protein